MKLLILASQFPKPHDPSIGNWALEEAKALKNEGVEITVISPSPWIPKLFALTPKLKKWASIPFSYSWDGIKAYYPKCLSYQAGNMKHRFFYYRYPYFRYYPEWWSVRSLLDSLSQLSSFDLIYSHHPLSEGKIGLQLKHRFNVPLVVIEHSVPDAKRALKFFHRRKAYKQVLTGADLMITVSRRLANILQKLLPSDFKKGINIVRNGIDLSKLTRNTKPKPASLQGKKVILSVGWLGARKGHKILIYAIKRVSQEFPNVVGLIIGSGEQKKELQKLIHNLGLENHVKLLGSKPHEVVLDYMLWCDVFALPSWNEAFGVVYAEAMGCGAPIIGTEGEGISEVITEGKEGLLVKKKDVDSLTQALLTILGDKDLAKRMGKEGQKLVRSELTWEARSKTMISIFKPLVY